MGKASVRDKINFKTKFYTFFMILEQKPVFAKTCRFFHLDCLRFFSKNLQAKQAIEKPVRTLFRQQACKYRTEYEYQISSITVIKVSWEDNWKKCCSIGMKPIVLETFQEQLCLENMTKSISFISTH